MNDIIEIHEDQKKDKGFTLIELLIVIVILGILATVTVFAVSGITDRGQTSACAADKKTVEVAVEAYNAENGVYPANVGDLVPTFIRSTPVHYTVGAGGAVSAVADADFVGGDNPCS